MPKLKRPRQTAVTSMRLTREALAKLGRRAWALGVSRTAVVEMLIREARWDAQDRARAAPAASEAP